MKNYFGYLLALWLIIGFTVLVNEKAYSQANSQHADSVKTSDGPSPTYVKGITTGRAKALVGAVVGLVSLIIGWRAKARSGANNRTVAIVALVLGLIGFVFSVVHLSTSAGAVFGSGSGKAGALFGLVFGLTGIVLGGLSLRKKSV